LSSANKVDKGGRILGKVPSKYRVEEIINSDSVSYSYYIEWQMDLMSTYNAYREMLDLGFDKAEIKAVVLTDPSEKELYNLRRIYGTSADKFFGNNDILTSHALIMLDQFVSFLTRHPSLKLEIGVHADNQGASEASQDLSRRRANAMQNYLINRGIKADRLYAVGYGDIKPIAPNYSEQGRKKNRRVELRIVND
jgi:outer membrane protein OmpA-like peptidoglycan-associated protein